MSTHNLTGVPRTMVINLRARADESARSDALFHDERAARHHIATHDNPLVVELGAGLSTRYYRVGQDRARWIKLNLPEAINIRRQLDSESAEHTFIACSVLDFAWMEQLPHTPPESILFTAEGLLVYFEEAELKQLIQRMRERFPGVTFVLDVQGKLTQMSVAKSAARAGATMKYFVKDERDVAAWGMTLVNVWSLFHLYPEQWRYQRYLAWLPLFRNAVLFIEARLY